MHTGICVFYRCQPVYRGVVGYFFTGPNNKGVYLLSSFIFFVVNVISVCMLPDNFLFLCGAVMNQCAVPVVSMAVSTIPVITKFDSFRRMFVCIMLSAIWSGVMWFYYFISEMTGANLS
ncbi:conjugal transfer protein TrbA [Escherichia coli]|nr:conjugal transfer protein TrbA [Escherichia coli]